MAKDVIGDVIEREVKKDDRSAVSNNPADRGGRTVYGISEKYNPDLWKNGPPTEAHSRERYEQRYIKWPGFDKIADPSLQAQLIDYGVHSGPAIAIQKLQTIVGADVDGVLGPQTLAALAAMDARMVNNLLVVARVKMIGKIVQKNPSQLEWLNGWINRACEFFLV